MKLYSRAYKDGDATSINKLYKRVANIDRTLPEYQWEWMNTWDGRGAAWLLFDKERDADDSLICQYSLIPTPFSFFGRKYLAGKTENCMSHPDCRNQGVYFPFEKKYFEEAKKRFQVFFTTAGHVANGAAGAVRKKLGYMAFDWWVTYVSYTNPDILEQRIRKHTNGKFGLKGTTATLAAKLLILPFVLYQKLFSFSLSGNFVLKYCDSKNAPLNGIERLFERNMHLYGITIDRKASYLKWRINENPYADSKYLLLYDKDQLSGYIIYYKNKNGSYMIVDIFAENKSKKIFRIMLKSLRRDAIDKSIPSVDCIVLEGNSYLRSILAGCGFIRKKIKLASKCGVPHGFLVYLPEEEKTRPESINPHNWFITALALEGRN